MPPPSAELILVRVLVEAHLATISHKRGGAFLRIASEILSTEESVTLLLPTRSTADRGAVNAARRSAIAMFRAWLPTFLARVPPTE